MQKIRLSDIPVDCQNKEYITKKYNVSRVTAWRLLSRRVDYICAGYHDKHVSVCPQGWDVITAYVMRYIRNVVAYQLKKWHIPASRYIDDITQECYINAYQKSGIWCEMPEEKSALILPPLQKGQQTTI